MVPNGSTAEIADTVSISQRLNQMISSTSRDYSAWRLLISDIETSLSEDKDTVSLAYDSFLSTFPLCNWHVEKYAHHKAKLCGADEAIKIYERGAQVAMYSVGFWADYFTFVTTCFKDPKDVRRLFGRALSFVGRDYYCHVIWDKYIKYEFSQEGWSFLAVSYIQALKFPTKKLQFYYNNFKQFVINLKDETGSEMITTCELNNVSASCTISLHDIFAVVKDMLESSDKSLECKALQKYKTLGEELYREACRLDKEIKCFETKIKRRYFYATPLDDGELHNWHQYLDYVEKQGHLDFAVSVYERCLIPCANYPEFWTRYVEFLESKGGRELALSALHRATQIFLKNIPEIHVFNARFKEQIGDIDGARAALILHATETDNSFVERVVTTANLERRVGNYDAASTTYKDAIKEATEKQKLHVLPKLYSHFARLTFLITGSVDDTRDVLVDGLHLVPHSKFLLEELIRFAMTHGGLNQVNKVNSIIDDSISPKSDEDEGLSARDREDISRLFLELVNLCGTVQDVMKAWNRHVKLFPQSLRTSNSNKSFVSAKLLSSKPPDTDGEALSDSPDAAETELKRQKLQVSSDHIPLRPREKRSDELIPLPDPKDPVAKDDQAPAPGNSRDPKQLAGHGFNDETVTGDQEQPRSAAPTSSASLQLASYPQESADEYGSQQNHHQLQAHQDTVMDPMLQYQYNQQQLMQHYQQQQQMYMQYNPYNQYQQYYMNPYNFQQPNPAGYQGPQAQALSSYHQAHQAGYQNPELGREGSSSVAVQKQRDEEKEQRHQQEGQKLTR